MKKIALLLFVALATIACKKEPTTYSFTDIIGYSQSPEKVFGETLPEYKDPYVIIYEYSSEGIVAEVKIDPVPYNQKLIFTPNEKQNSW